MPGVVEPETVGGTEGAHATQHPPQFDVRQKLKDGLVHAVEAVLRRVTFVGQPKKEGKEGGRHTVIFDSLSSLLAFHSPAAVCRALQRISDRKHHVPPHPNTLLASTHTHTHTHTHLTLGTNRMMAHRPVGTCAHTHARTYANGRTHTPSALLGPTLVPRHATLCLGCMVIPTTLRLCMVILTALGLCMVILFTDAQVAQVVSVLHADAHEQDTLTAVKHIMSSNILISKPPTINQ